MSTRCQIMVKGSEILVYKHSDGYPDGVLPWLTEIVSRFVKERGNDPCYCLAVLLRHRAIQEEAEHKEQMLTNDFYKDRPQYLPSNQFIDWGLDCEIHGDIEYLYVADLSGVGKVYVHNDPDEFERIYRAAKVSR